MRQAKAASSAILEALREPDFRRRVANLGHYDFRDAGKILYAAP